MASKKHLQPLVPEKYFHIYNRGNNRETLFYHTENYECFLKKYFELMTEYLTTYAYCLLPNHFHFLVKIKSHSDKDSSNASNQFRKLFISHARKINFQQDRRGSLFEKNFCRVEVKQDEYLRVLIGYIHKNPFSHMIRFRYDDYVFSSFSAFYRKLDDRLAINEAKGWFLDRDHFMEYHHRTLEGNEYGDLRIEKLEAKRSLKIKSDIH